MVSAVAMLSTTATTFDCHLLQCQSALRPLDTLGTTDQQRRLRASLADVTANVEVVAPRETVVPEFPEWMTTSISTERNLSAVAAWSSQTSVNQENQGLDWLHLELPASDDRSLWIASALETVAGTQSGQPQDTLIITAIAGESADHDRFESLLWEGSIRLPLWVRDRNNGFGRVNRPTGSFDVLETVLSCLDGHEELRSTDRSVDLRFVRAESSGVPTRSILMTGEGYEAIRTPDFFFVRRNSEEFGEKTALYAKPHDVWNVHDLRHEFPDVADEMLRQLPPIPGAGG